MFVVSGWDVAWVCGGEGVGLKVVLVDVCEVGVCECVWGVGWEWGCECVLGGSGDGRLGLWVRGCGGVEVSGWG